MRALPASFRADGEAAAAAAVVDPAAWGDRGVDARTELVGVLQTAIVQRSTVRLTYFDRRRRGLPGGSKEM